MQPGDLTPCCMTQRKDFCDNTINLNPRCIMQQRYLILCCKMQRRDSTPRCKMQRRDLTPHCIMQRGLHLSAEPRLSQEPSWSPVAAWVSDVTTLLHAPRVDFHAETKCINATKCHNLCERWMSHHIRTVCHIEAQCIYEVKRDNYVEK